ncbi:MAG: Maf family protein [Candidatus Omnitrophica bacterium]|nr:Maf family protein [Candidatus Omnitrophota bacterium]
MKKLILASASDRRKRILEMCGIVFEVVTSGAIEETNGGKHVSDLVRLNAARKAEDVARARPGSVVLGADTLVAHGDDILGKPPDENTARQMLKRFSGSEIEVYTGLSLIDTATARGAEAVEVSELYVAPLTEEEVERIFPLMGPYDKAGGFTMEGPGAMIFDDIHGSYFNILGLPVTRLRKMFAEIGLDILDFVKGYK